MEKGSVKEKIVKDSRGRPNHLTRKRKNLIGALEKKTRSTQRWRHKSTTLWQGAKCLGVAGRGVDGALSGARKGHSNCGNTTWLAEERPGHSDRSTTVRPGKGEKEDVAHRRAPEKEKVEVREKESMRTPWG